MLMLLLWLKLQATVIPIEQDWNLECSLISASIWQKCASSVCPQYILTHLKDSCDCVIMESWRSLCSHRCKRTKVECVNVYHPPSCTYKAAQEWAVAGWVKRRKKKSRTTVRYHLYKLSVHTKQCALCKNTRKNKYINYIRLHWNDFP